MVTLELIPENEDQRLPKKPQVQSCITQFFKNKKWVLFGSVFKENQCIFFRNPPVAKIVTFSLRQKGCHYFEKCHYFGCHYFEWAQYLKICQKVKFDPFFDLILKCNKKFVFFEISSFLSSIDFRILVLARYLFQCFGRVWAPKFGPAHSISCWVWVGFFVPMDPWK